ncbi:MAG: hypothetical protein KC593_13210 [Myxococcales bacterium]|nr:hypothetical protein [Myxococcales bacterium]MCB9629834.1 hypothetical protein [Sandaracinaceae bacterium]
MLEFAGSLSRLTTLASLEVCLLTSGCMGTRTAATEGGETPPQIPSEDPVAAPQPLVVDDDADDAAAEDESPRRIEALRLGSDVILLEPRGVWTTLAVTHTQEGGRVRVVLSSAVDPFGPRDASAVQWVEATAPRNADDFVGTWAISGSVATAGGAIGWRREYRLAADGRYTFSAYPSLSGEGTWRQREPRSAHVLLEGMNGGDAVGLVRDPRLHSPDVGVLAAALVQVRQTDTPPPPPPGQVPSANTAPSDPLAAGPARTTTTEVTTDADGAFELTLQPWARQLVITDDRQRRVTVVL